MDYLGTFAQRGVQLACNWYIGEPDQSGGGYHHAADSAKQAMFNEQGEPNPKYWAFKLMSDHFRDTALVTRSTENDAFSIYAGLNVASSQLVVAAHYKGLYYPWYHETHPGASIEGQGNSNATVVISNFTIRGVASVKRFGRYDPAILHMATVGVTGRRCFIRVRALSIYLHSRRTNPPVSRSGTPERVARAGGFRAYESGVEVTRPRITRRTRSRRITTMTCIKMATTATHTVWLSVTSVLRLVPFFRRRRR